MSERRDNDNGRVTLAVLQNDLMHLVAQIEFLRGDFQAFCSRMAQWQDKTEVTAQSREIRIDRLENRVKLVFWVLGVVSTVVVALVIAGLKAALGI